MMYLTHFEISRYLEIQDTFSEVDKLEEVSRLLHFYHDGRRFNTDITPTDLGWELPSE